MRTVVYTCITGCYDQLPEIKKEESFDYICFTNNRYLKSDCWELRYVEEPTADHILQRKVKILGYRYLQEYDLLIYLDAPVEMKMNDSIHRLLEQECDLEHYDMISFRHHLRDCIYQEINECVFRRKETMENALRMEAFLKDQNYPEHNGLTENTVIIRKNIGEINLLMDDWFYMVEHYSGRDQLSFNYCLWKRPVRIQILDINVYDNQYFKHAGHKKLRILSCRLVFDRADEYDYRHIKEQTVIANSGHICIEQRCPRDTDQIQVSFPEQAGLAIGKIDIWLNAQPVSDKPVFLRFRKAGPSYYSVGNSVIILSGDFKENDLVRITMELSGNDEEALVRVIGERNKVIAGKNKKLAAQDERIAAQTKRLSEQDDKIAEQTKKLAEQSKKIRTLAKTNKNLRQIIRQTEQSCSYRVGRRITWIPRKIRDCFRNIRKKRTRETKKAVVIYFDIRKSPLFKSLFEASGVTHENHFRNKTMAILTARPFARKIPMSLIYTNPKLKNGEDKIIVFDSFSTPRYLNWLCKKHPEDRIILWFWNPAQKGFFCGNVDPRVEMWTYSQKDSKKYGIRLNTQFYFDCLQPSGKDKTTYKPVKSPKILFVGREKKREQALRTIQQQLEDAGAMVEMYLTPSPGRKKNNWLYETTMPYEEIVNMVRKTDIILDYSNDPNAGLSLRPLEALFFEKKLITNNVTIRNMDFYHPNDIYILNRDKRNFEEFFASEFHPVEKTVKEKYLLSNWLRRFDLSESENGN